MQATLGILTLLHQVPIDLALTHQAVAIVVLTLAIFQTERLVARRTERAERFSRSGSRLKLNDSNCRDCRKCPVCRAFVTDDLANAFVSTTALLETSGR